MNIKTMFFVLASLLLSAAQASVIKTSVSVKCTFSESSAIDSFIFDLYPTGHPMAGISMYSGMFQVHGSDFSCPYMTGYIKSGHEKPYFTYEAVANCLDKVDFMAEVKTLLYEANKQYSGTLSYRVSRPLDSGEYKTVPMTCMMVK